MWNPYPHSIPHTHVTIKIPTEIYFPIKHRLCFGFGLSSHSMFVFLYIMIKWYIFKDSFFDQSIIFLCNNLNTNESAYILFTGLE